MPDIKWCVILVLAGFLAGIVNTIAGGGSFLTLPALMLFGLDPRIANATNRVAVLFSSGSAVITFSKHGHLDRAMAKRLTIPTLLGVPVGAMLAVYLPSETLEPVIGCIFLAMAVLLLSNPKRILESTTPSSQTQRWVGIMFFGIGIYVGFLQAGMGILVLLAMGLLNTGDLVASNGVKNLIGFIVTLAATMIFALHGIIDWVPGLIMGLGNLAGGIVGARLAIRKGNRLVFAFLVVVMLATGLKLLVSGIAQLMS